MDHPDWYYKTSRKDILPFIPANVKKLLDVGCGEGNFGLLVKEQFGAEVWGIEYNNNAAMKALNKLDNFLVGDVQQLIHKIDIRDFDCITFLDVLEHLVDPYTVLKKANYLLASSGSIVVSIPNILYIGNLFKLLILKDWQYQDHGILDSSHLRFFTAKSFAATLKDAGFSIQKSQGIHPCRYKLLFFLFNLLTLGYFRESNYYQLLFIARRE